MSILDNIKAASLAARKARNADHAASLSTLIGDIENLAKAGRGVMTDAVAITVVKKFIKNVIETLEHVATAGGDTTVKQLALQDELALFTQFVPKQMTEEELKTLFNKYITEGVADVGDAMKRLKTEFAGKYDGALASRLLKSFFTMRNLS